MRLATYITLLCIGILAAFTNFDDIPFQFGRWLEQIERSQ